MDSMKRQKDMTWEYDPPLSEAVQYVLGKGEGQLLIARERMVGLGQSRDSVQLWMCLVVKVKSAALKNNIA